MQFKQQPQISYPINQSSANLTDPKRTWCNCYKQNVNKQSLHQAKLQTYIIKDRISYKLRHVSESKTASLLYNGESQLVANLKNNSSTPSTIAKPDRSKDEIFAHNTALCSPYFESK